MPKYIEKVEKFTIPVIPLRGIVSFPSIPVNFELEREISKNACQAATSCDMLVFLLTQKDIRVDDPMPEDLYSVGCVAKIKQTLKKPQNGNIRVVAEGYCRASVIEIRREKDHYVADVMAKTMTGDFSMSDLRTEAVITEMMNTLEEMIRFMPQFSDDFLVTAGSITNP